MNKGLAFGVGIIILVSVLISLNNQSNVEIVQNCKIINQQQQQIISGSNGNIETQIRYLVITDKETFICESSLLNGKYNNSDIFWRLKKDSTYNLKVCGVGKSALTEYRNVLEIVK